MAGSRRSAARSMPAPPCWGLAAWTSSRWARRPSWWGTPGARVAAARSPPGGRFAVPPCLVAAGAAPQTFL
eukprot:8032935-Lingulodinium_polyedra.AAC.1